MHSIHNTVGVDAPRAVVWRVLTSRELVREWAAAFLDDIDIRCGWREGSPVAWKAPDGTVLVRGIVTAFEPERLLRFDYPLDRESISPARHAAFSDAWTIDEAGRTLLTATTRPLTADDYRQLERPALEAVQRIKSLAEEAATIRALRQPGAPAASHRRLRRPS